MQCVGRRLSVCAAVWCVAALISGQRRPFAGASGARMLVRRGISDFSVGAEAPSPVGPPAFPLVEGNETAALKTLHGIADVCPLHFQMGAEGGEILRACGQSLHHGVIHLLAIFSGHTFPFRYAVTPRMRAMRSRVAQKHQGVRSAAFTGSA